jgi:hypothetical protein
MANAAGGMTADFFLAQSLASKGSATGNYVFDKYELAKLMI